jgi:uncharacterized membrane protein
MLYALLKAAHVLAIVVWVGGMAFAHFFLRPSLDVLAPPERLRLMHAVLGRFFRVVSGLVLIVLGSGVWMIGRVARQAVQGGGAFTMPWDWSLMTGLGLLMAAIYGHIRFAQFKNFERAVQAADWPRAGAALARIRQWVALNLTLGLLIVVVVLVF